MRKIVSLPTRRATIRFARALAPRLCAGDLLILTGELGAGKTFFTRALCRALGVHSSIAVTSPTFMLVHEIKGRLLIAHADLYRVKEAAEVEQLGLRQLRGEGALLIVEWGTAYAAELGGDALVVSFDVQVEGGRVATLEATGQRSQALLLATFRGTEGEDAASC